MDILLSVHVDKVFSESPRAILRLNKAGLLGLIAKVEQVADLQTRDGSIYCIEHWDHVSVRWFAENRIASRTPGLSALDTVICRGHTRIQKRLGDKIVNAWDVGCYRDTTGAGINCRCVSMIAEHDAVHWRASVEHCDSVMETSIIPIAALRRYAARA